MKKIVITAIAVVAAFAAGMEFNSWYYNFDNLYEVNQSKSKLIEAYDAYNKQCESLLDSIAIWDNSFMDTVGETDAYMDYLESREHLDSLIWNK